MKLYVNASVTSEPSIWNNGGIWYNDRYEEDGHAIRWSVLVFEEGSEYGIDGGRISKLWISIDGKWAANYDRGWDVRPKSALAKSIYNMLISEYN